MHLHLSEILTDSSAPIRPQKKVPVISIGYLFSTDIALIVTFGTAHMM